MKMRVPDIELHNLSRYRGELMGAAMLFVILFHVSLPRHDAFFGLRRCGNVGVDMFLFLSGIGLWFSWTKTPEWRHFFRNRLVRIYPAWLLMAALYYIPRYIQGVGYSRSLPDLIANIAIGWSFWRADDLAFWFVPSILALYLIAPAYMELIRRHPIYRWLPVVMMLWCVAVQWVQPVHAAVGHIEIFWSRVPIFLLGINMGDLVKRKVCLDGWSIVMIVVTFALSLGLCVYLEQQLHGRFPLFIERMVYIPLTVSGLLLLNRLFRRTPQWFNRFCRLVGALSLEAYLIHIHFVLHYIAPYRLGYWPTVALTILLTLPLAWMLHWIVGRGIVLATRAHKE